MTVTTTDQNDNRIARLPRREELDRSAYVAKVTDRYTQSPIAGLTPARLAAAIKQSDIGAMWQVAELYEQMVERDGHLAGLLQTRKLAVTGLDWSMVPADDTPFAQEIADFCEDAIDKINHFGDAQKDMLDATEKGYSVMEIDWELGRKVWRPRALTWVHPKKITFLDSFDPLLITEENRDGIPLAPYKFIYHQFKARSGYVNRGGLMRTLAWLWMFKSYAVKDWMGFIELFAHPMRVGKYAAGSTDADKDALLAALSSMGTDFAAIISAETEIVLQEAQRSGTVNVYDVAMKWFDTQQAYCILGQTLTSQGGQDGSGSMALGNVHNDVRLDLVIDDGKALDLTITEQLVAPLVYFNFGMDAPVPWFRHDYPQDVAAILARIKTLQEMGYPVSQEYVEEISGVPVAKEGETVLTAPTAAPAFQSFTPASVIPSAPPPAPAVTAKAAPIPTDPDASPVIPDIKALNDKAGTEAVSGVASLLSQIEEIVGEAPDLEALKAALADGALDVSDFAESMKLTLAAAHLAGRDSIGEEAGDATT
ncbi:MAG: DUF935 family protein [Patescibacteria group bacterium]